MNDSIMGSPTLTVLRGLPGSNKSLWAKTSAVTEPNTRVVSRDSIIESKYGAQDESFLSEKMAQKVSRAEIAQVEALLAQGQNVIVDSRNLTDARVRVFKKVAERNGSNITVKDFPISPETAIQRNQNRSERPVPPEVLHSLTQQVYPHGEYGLGYVEGQHTPQPFSTPSSKRGCIVFDIDGTLCDVRPIRFTVSNGRQDIDLFHRLSIYCPPNHTVVRMLNDAHENGVPVVLVTARQERYREITDNWLSRSDITFENMYMRKNGDNRPDYETKKDIYAELSEHYNVLRAVDDNPQVLRLWKELKVPTSQVEEFVVDGVSDEDMFRELPVDNPLQSGRCIRCNRPLKRGEGFIGPDCAKML